MSEFFTAQNFGLALLIFGVFSLGNGVARINDKLDAIEKRLGGR